MTAATHIRRYSAADYDDVSAVCLRTAASGGDATGLYSRDELMPDIFVRPYVTLEPQFAWVVEHEGLVRGYIVAAPDTRRFAERYAGEWLPGFQSRYRRAHPPVTDDDRIRELGFTPERMLIPEVDEYPAHLHIDLLPEIQGRGWGRALIETLAAALRAEAVPGLHLSMAPTNTAARAFYDRLGFHELPSSTSDAPVLGMRIST